MRKSESDAEFSQGVDQACRTLATTQALEQDPQFMSWVDDTLGLTPAGAHVEKRPSRKWPLVSAAAAVVMVAVVFTTGKFDFGVPKADGTVYRYITGVGERKTAELKDGSKITLNTSTLLLSDINPEYRRIDLERGEAYFDVAKDASKPFVVVLGGQSVTVLGTEFSIRKDPTKFVLAVTEGVVAVHEYNENGSPQALLSEQGSPETFDQRHIPANWVVEYDANTNTLNASKSDAVNRMVSWRHGIVHFVDEPLSNVVYELNRYSAKKIMIEGGTLVNEPITASFKVDSLSSALSGLGKSHSIQVIHHFDHILLSEK